jgi:predicted ATPase
MRLRAHHTDLTLNRLTARDVRALVGQVLATKALSGEAIEQVIERTAGVPLFVEELTARCWKRETRSLGRARFRPHSMIR